MQRTVAFTFFVILGLIVGCSSGKGKNVAAGPAVLDVGPAPIPAAEPQLASLPINDNPQVAFAPSPSPTAPSPIETASPIAAAPSPAAKTYTVKTYTVKKGDTLFAIAKAQLGSGRDWQKIAAVNPGLTPTKLRAGQQLAMP